MARRSRVLSFMSQWSAAPRSSSEPPPEIDDTPIPSRLQRQQATPNKLSFDFTRAESGGSGAADKLPTRSTLPVEQTPPSSPNPHQRTRAESRTNSRPVSMVQTFQPPLMEVAQDTLPELQPIFTFLNSHSNKLYQEGYFLKLHDLDARGRPSIDRNWQECFAQLVGTVLSLWDAAALDAAGEDGEVVPNFINLADASIKMLESLPMDEGGQVLNNVLSISTAANNRYLLHFNSLNSLTQWTAGIRLSLFEYTGLQEAYTGSLIAGKGRSLNNIRTIMERTKFKTEDWCRVRFGAGTPWRRCWFVITPPDEKEVAKMQKMHKKKTPYEKLPSLKGDLKFYESKRINKKTKPIATITDAWSAYAVYPQSKPLIDQSTLVKVEGRITIHSAKETSADGFVFVMPEVHPAVSGFEMMLRFLFPVWDIFTLYGRPNKLIAETLDTRGLMFAMPRERRYGYLELLDVSSLIHAEGATTWTERQWRRELKELTSKRMLTMEDDEVNVGLGSRRNTTSRASLPGRRSMTRFEDSTSRTNSPSQVNRGRATEDPASQDFHPAAHKRSLSAAIAQGSRQQQSPVRPFNESTSAGAARSGPPPPLHQTLPIRKDQPPQRSFDEFEGANQELINREATLSPELRTLRTPAPAPVAVPPSMAHMPSQKPPVQPNQASELRRGQAHLDQDTMNQLVEATTPGVELRGAYGFPAEYQHADQGGANGHGYHEFGGRAGGAPYQRAVNTDTNEGGRVRADDQTQGPLNSTSAVAPPAFLPRPSIDSRRSNPSPDRTSNLASINPSQPARISPTSSFHSKHSSSTNDKPDIATAAAAAALVGSATRRTPSPRISEPSGPQRPQPERASTSFSIRRKPVQRSTSGASVVYSPPTSSARNSFPQPNSDVTGAPSQPIATVNMEDDGPAKPRMGKMKTIGSLDPHPIDVVVGETHYSQSSRPKSTLIPDFDFGPTYRLDPTQKDGPKMGSDPAEGSVSSQSPSLLQPPSPLSSDFPTQVSRPSSSSRTNSRPSTSQSNRPTLDRPSSSKSNLALRPLYAHQNPSPQKPTIRSSPATSTPSSNVMNSGMAGNAQRDAVHRHVLANLEMLSHDLPTWPMGPPDLEEIPYDGMRLPAILVNTLQQFRPRPPHQANNADDARERAERGRIFQLRTITLQSFQQQQEQHQRQVLEHSAAVREEVALQQQTLMEQQAAIQQGMTNSMMQRQQPQPQQQQRPPSRNRLQKRNSVGEQSNNQRRGSFERRSSYEASPVQMQTHQQQQQIHPNQMHPVAPIPSVNAPPRYAQSPQPNARLNPLPQSGYGPSAYVNQHLLPSKPDVQPLSRSSSYSNDGGFGVGPPMQSMQQQRTPSYGSNGGGINIRSSSGTESNGLQKPARQHRGPPKSFSPGQFLARIGSGSGRRGGDGGQ